MILIWIEHWYLLMQSVVHSTSRWQLPHGCVHCMVCVISDIVFVAVLCSGNVILYFFSISFWCLPILEFKNLRHVSRYEPACTYVGLHTFFLLFFLRRWKKWYLWNNKRYIICYVEPVGNDSDINFVTPNQNKLNISLHQLVKVYNLLEVERYLLPVNRKWSRCDLAYICLL